MTNSQMIHALPGIGSLWNLSPVMAAIVAFSIGFLGVCFWMVAEGRAPWNRQLYYAFVVGEGIAIPLYIFIANQVMNDSRPINAWYNTSNWHWAVLIVGTCISVGMEVLAVAGNQYTWNQEHSPSKLWHTVTFIFLFYWCVSSLPFVLGGNGLARWLVGFPFLIYFFSMVADWSRPLKLYDAHLEGTYVPWEWHVRRP